MGVFDFFTGKKAQKGLDQAKAGALAGAEKSRAGQTGAWDAFGNQARNDLGAGWQYVQGQYSPLAGQHAEGGEAGRRQYALARGDQDAFDEYMNNPAQAALQTLTAKRLHQGSNANGKSWATSAGNSIANRGWLDNFGNYVNQNALLGAEERGRADNARSALANYGYSYGKDLAGVGAQQASGLANAYGQEGSMVNNAWGQWGQGTAANANTFAQNLLGVGGLALKATGWGGFGAGNAGNKVA
jgi:hypothetical protein